MSDEPQHMTVGELAEALGFGELLDRPANQHEPHSCGYLEGTFACKIRHIQINTGAAKAAND